MVPTLAPRAERLDGRRVRVGTVHGGERSTFWTIPHLGDDAFRQALEESLRRHGAWAADGRYQADAVILREEIYGGSTGSPDVGAELRIRHMVRDLRDPQWTWQTDVVSIHWVPTSEAFVGIVRTRRAIEGAAAKNLGEMLQRLLPQLERLGGS
jgi:hypothetical protein